ncbi:hypothetical protein QJQ45_018777 [Haematococcus lacustris]|nr:hypothetical protein QJQ45_018777 [Haematococcus lacustris]
MLAMHGRSSATVKHRDSAMHCEGDGGALGSGDACAALDTTTPPQMMAAVKRGRVHAVRPSWQCWLPCSSAGMLPTSCSMCESQGQYNKQLFGVFPYPLTTTSVQVSSILPLALIHVVGNVLTNISLGLVAVSFTHTVKVGCEGGKGVLLLLLLLLLLSVQAAEPLFSVMFSGLFLGQVPPLPVLLTLLPIVGGVVLASLSEATFNWTGFLSAILSNITFQSRNVLSKKLMISKTAADWVHVDPQGAVDNVNLFQIITIMSFFLLLPVSLVVESAPLLPQQLAAAGWSSTAADTLWQRLLVAGLCFHSYQQLSYMILSRVAPVTHSIGNCVKRVVVIAASLVIFQNPVSLRNAAGELVLLHRWHVSVSQLATTQLARTVGWHCTLKLQTAKGDASQLMQSGKPMTPPAPEATGRGIWPFCMFNTMAVLQARHLRCWKRLLSSAARNGSSHTQEMLLLLLLTCCRTPPPCLQPLNLLVVTQYSSVSQLATTQLAGTVGWQSKVTVLSSSRIVTELTNNLQANLSGFYDAVVYSNKYIADFARLGLFMDLTPLVTASPTVAWADFTPYYRGSSAYGGQLVGLPLVGVTYALYFRRDVLLAAGVTITPSTWDDVVTLAERLNGTDFNGDGVGDWAVCHTLTTTCQAPHILMDIAANVMQTLGPTHGFLYDPDTLEPLLVNDGFAYSMQVYRRLAALNPIFGASWNERAPDCNAGTLAFLNGTCLFTIQNSAVFKGTLLAPSLRGKVGSAMVPGVTEVWDRVAGCLVPCSAQLCPFATPQQLLNGSVRLVNYAPWKGTVGYSGSVAGAISPEYQQAAFNYLELATATNFSWQTVLDPTSIWAPLRDSMISGPNALQPYLAAGYDLATTKEWLSVTKATLSGGNSVSAAGLPNPDAYQSFMEAAAHNITYSSLWATANMSRSGWTDNVTLVLQALDAQTRALMAATGPTPLLLSYYRASLGLHSLTPPPGPQQPAPSSSIQKPLLIAAITVPLAVVCAVSIVAWALLIQLQRARKRSLTGKVKPPGAGPETTLVLTDIESSTLLFETMPQGLMDCVMKCHHTTVRAVSLRNNGYEWSTEGDSFLIAFHTAVDALLFAVDLQEELLQCDWPQELLQHAACAPVWVHSAGSHTHPLSATSPSTATPNMNRSSSIGSLACAPKPGARSTSHSQLKHDSKKPSGQLHRAALAALAPRLSLGSAHHMVRSPGLLVANNSTLSNSMETPLAADDLMSFHGIAIETRPSSGWTRCPRPLHEAAKPRRFSTSNSPNGTSFALAHTPDLEPGLRAEGSELQVAAAASLHASLQCTNVAQQLSSMIDKVDGPGPRHVLLFSGLRVRIGIHSGVPAASDITFNRSSGRMQYSGAGLALARAVQGVACGGQVLLSEATAKLVSGNTGKDFFHPLLLLLFLFFFLITIIVTSHNHLLLPAPPAPSAPLPAMQLPVEALRARLAIAHEGEHLLPGVTPALLHAASHFGPGPTPGCQTPLPQPCSEPPARPGMPTHPGPAQAHSEEQVHQLSACSLSAAVNLYSAVSHSLVHRVPLLCGKIRSSECLAPGYLAAPSGRAAICFMNVAGVASLREWDSEVLQQVLRRPYSRAHTHAGQPASLHEAADCTSLQALQLYTGIAQRSLCALGGYLVEASEGMLLVAFPAPAPAIRQAHPAAQCSRCQHCRHRVILPGGRWVWWLTAWRRPGPPPSWTMSWVSRRPCAASHRSTLSRPLPCALHAACAGEEVAVSSSARRGRTHELLCSPLTSTFGAAANTIPDPHSATLLNVLPAAPTAVRDPGSPSSCREILETSQVSLHLLNPGQRAGLEERRVSTPSAYDGLRRMRQVLFRGLRIKYRGKCMNRASRIAGITKSGQVWASDEAWTAAELAINEEAVGYGLQESAHLARSLQPIEQDDKLVEREQALRVHGRVEQAVVPSPMAPVRLKGIVGEVTVVAVALESKTGMALLSDKNSMTPTATDHTGSLSSGPDNPGQHGASLVALGPTAQPCAPTGGAHSARVPAPLVKLELDDDDDVDGTPPTSAWLPGLRGALAGAGRTSQTRTSATLCSRHALTHVTSPRNQHPTPPPSRPPQFLEPDEPHRTSLLPGVGQATEAASPVVLPLTSKTADPPGSNPCGTAELGPADDDEATVNPVYQHTDTHKAIPDNHVVPIAWAGFDPPTARRQPAAHCSVSSTPSFPLPSGAPRVFMLLGQAVADSPTAAEPGVGVAAGVGVGPRPSCSPAHMEAIEERVGEEGLVSPASPLTSKPARPW